MLIPYKNPGLIEAGCDEAGRGCLAGPVVAAAVILGEDFDEPLLNDSKQLKKKDRDFLRKEIERKSSAWAVGVITPARIDKVNILNASFEAMHKALAGLHLKPEFILVDGNRFKPYNRLPFSCEIKGDGRFQSIAAASILAKTHRDELMLQLHRRFPVYTWDENKGYPTPAHRAAIREYGPCRYHRKSFRLLPQGEQLRIF